jgi:hypothetical protein
MLDSVLESLLKVQRQGEKSLAFIDSGEDPSIFLDMLDAYLILLENWQAEHKEFLAGVSDATVDLSVSERESLRASLEQIKVLHANLMERSQDLMSEVHSELGNINKRARGIRKYVDTLPSRVSVRPVKRG